jgi:predicted metal-binding membrane protein
MTEPGPRTTILRDAGWLMVFATIASGWLALLWLSLPEGGPAPPVSTALGWFDRSLDGAIWRSLCAARADTSGAAVVVAMWLLMTLAMMLPTVIPMLAAHREIVLAGRRQANWTPTALFTLGYAIVWLVFASVAAVMQLALSGTLIEAEGIVRSGWLAAMLLGIAGLYQFSALKAQCLSQCRSPMLYLLGRWRAGFIGALQMGLHHGATCLGCCWALMLLAFVGGTMNLAWMGLAMLLMIVEKLPDVGRRLTMPLGIALMAAALLAVAITAGAI